MTSTTLRRSATVLSGLALGAVLGTPAYAKDKAPESPAGQSATQADNTQGKSHSNPDGGGVDKPYAADGQPAKSQGSSDFDGNNGCGNDADRADDNNGNCGGPKKDKDHDKPAKAEEPKAKPAKQAEAPKAKPAKQAEPAAQPRAPRPAAPSGCKNHSRPDQDGVGMDRGVVNNDKTAPGADCNNGCGNDDDREDDNNGNCGKKKVRPTPAPAPAVAPRAAVPAPSPAPVVPAPVVPAPAAPVAPAPVAPAPVVRPVTPTQVLGVRQTRAVPVRPAVAPARVSAAPTLQDVTLPFTGSNERALLFVGVMTIAAGAVITELGRASRQTA